MSEQYNNFDVLQIFFNSLSSFLRPFDFWKMYCGHIWCLDGAALSAFLPCYGFDLIQDPLARFVRFRPHYLVRIIKKQQQLSAAKTAVRNILIWTSIVRDQGK